MQIKLNRQIKHLPLIPLSKKIYQSFLKLVHKILLFLIEPSEPKITKRTDLSGNYWWEVYDPKTGSYKVFNDEAEVRMWLEKCHYQ